MDKCIAENCRDKITVGKFKSWRGFSYVSWIVHEVSWGTDCYFAAAGAKIGKRSDAASYDNFEARNKLELWLIEKRV